MNELDPPRSWSISRANTDGLSKRGRHSQSMLVQAQPVDAGVGSDEGEDAAVADDAMMQGNRLDHLTGSIRQAASSNALAQSNTVWEPTRSRSARIRRRCSSAGISSEKWYASANESTA